MNVSRERESRERKSSSRRGTRNAKLSGGRSANFPRSFDAASCNFQRAPPTFGYYYSSTLETSKRVGGAQIRRLITNESERGEACPNRIALLLPPSIIRGINLRKLGEIGGEKLAVRERERDLKGEKKKNCSGRRVWYLRFSRQTFIRDEHRIRNDTNTRTPNTALFSFPRHTRCDEPPRFLSLVINASKRVFR